MSIRFLLCLGFILAAIRVCRADSGCPNEPVTPLPTTPKPSTECPNLPVTPMPTKAPAESVTSSTTAAPYTTEKSGLENQPPGQLVSAGSSAVNETNAKQNSSCVHAPDYGCMVSQCCCQLCCPPLSITTSTMPPETVIECPPGTVLLGRRCHLLYCPQGSRMINDRCVVIECPQGTIWSGHSCSVPQPIVQNIKFESTILTLINQTRPQIVLNNTNNIYVNASLSLHFDEPQHTNDCHNENSDCSEETLEDTTSTPNSTCWEVMTPRICKQYNNRWHCYSRRSRRCGEFCVAPIIYLRPDHIHATSQYVVMPPMQNDCQSYDNCGPEMGGYDCSGCAFDDMEHCSYYCYRYICPPHKCDYYDQEKYCSDNMEVYGCQAEDGCYGNWCL